MKILRFGGLSVIALLAALTISLPLAPTRAAKPKGPSLPPVRYEIKYWNSPGLPGSPDLSINHMNNLGQIVGWYFDAAGEQRAYLLDVNQSTAVDLESTYGQNGDGVRPGWKVASAVGINNSGVIVGYLTPVGSPYGGGGQRIGFLIDTGVQPPIFEEVNVNLGPDAYARQINENGDILGAYTHPDGTTGIYLTNRSTLFPVYTLHGVQPAAHLNNPTAIHNAQVAGTWDDGSQRPFRWTPQTSLVPEPFGTFATTGGVRGINDSGTFCGSTLSGKPAKTYPFYLDTSNHLLSNSYGTWGQDINSEGDVLLAPAGTRVGGIFRLDWSAYGNYADINNLVVGTSNDLTTWNSATSLALYEMSDHGELLGGQIAGYLRFSNGSIKPFLLTPRAP